MSDYELIMSFIYLSGALFGFIVSITKGLNEGGAKEVFENLFLYFLLMVGFERITSPPVDHIDNLTAAAFFAAFGICRIARSVSKKAD